MKTPRSLFGTSGIRGDAEKLLTNQFCFDIGRSFSLYLKEKSKNGMVAIGMDPRGSSPRIKDSIENGIGYEGIRVSDEGNVCVPAVNYILKESSRICASIMVTGSHIKPHLNGIKFFTDEREILKEDEKRIEKIYLSIKDKVKEQKIKSRNMIEDSSRAIELYIDYLVNNKESVLPKWRVVVDCGDGAQSDIMPQALKRLGLDVIELHCTIQGEFYSRDTEVESDFDELIKKVVDEKANFGIGYDSDGDRCIFVDEKGNFIPGDYTGALIALNYSKGKVVTPINSSQVIDKIGLNVIRTRVGSPYVVEAMINEKSNFGFEANGGCIFGEMLSRDGGRTTVEIINIIANKGKGLSEIISEIPKYYIQRSKIEYKWELKDMIIEKARKEFGKGKIDETDGLKIWIDENTWILFRSSQNAPEFRVFVESNEENKAKDLLNKGLGLVKEVVNEK